MTKPAKILIIATSAGAFAGSGASTGLWLEELTTPYYAFKDAGADVTVASMAGGAIPIDPRSVKQRGENEDSVERYLSDPELQRAVEKSSRFETLDTDAYDAVFLPGGHGAMFDYPNSIALADLIARFARDGRVVSAVCHGPASLVSVRTVDGAPFVRDRTVAGFTDSEERAVGLEDAVPFLLETRLRELGARYVSAPDFAAFAVRDGDLVTGQNPASAAKTAALVMEALADRSRRAGRSAA